MGDFTKNLSRWEFTCPCGCGFNTVDFELANVLQELCDHFGTTVNITSGCRCFKNNLSIQGAAKNSKHMEGQAADFKLSGIQPTIVYDYLNEKYPTKFGIGLYKNRTHLDVRSNRARWKTL